MDKPFEIPYEEIERRLQLALERAALTVEMRAKMDCPVDTGTLRRSITHSTNYPETIIGSNEDYAPYVEAGTGIYASDGNGRKDVPWFFMGADGKGHLTKGNKATHFLENAIKKSRNAILKSFQNIF